MKMKNMLKNMFGNTFIDRYENQKIEDDFFLKRKIVLNRLEKYKTSSRNYGVSSIHTVNLYTVEGFTFEVNIGFDTWHESRVSHSKSSSSTYDDDSSVHVSGAGFQFSERFLLYPIIGNCQLSNFHSYPKNMEWEEKIAWRRDWREAFADVFPWHILGF